MWRLFANPSLEVQEAIRRRATELYQSSGAVPGHDAENWYQAEAEILRESVGTPVRRAIVVNIDDFGRGPLRKFEIVGHNARALLELFLENRSYFLDGHGQ